MSTIATERRRPRRILFKTDADLFAKGVRSQGRTRNVSIGGTELLLCGGEPPALADALTIHMASLGFGARARVRWVRRDACDCVRVGLEFLDLIFA